MPQATLVSPSDIKPVLGVLKSVLGAFAHVSKASHTHAGMHTLAHAQAGARTHTPAHTHTQAHAGARRRRRMHAWAHAWAHGRTHGRMGARTCAHAYTHVRPTSPTQKKEALFREASKPHGQLRSYFKNVNLYKVESI